MMDRTLMFEDFSDKLESEFVISEDGVPPIAFRLIEAELLPAHNGPRGMRPPFSLVFATPQMLPQRAYQVTHDRLGTITLFLVPIGRDEHGFQHQAVFN